MVDRVYPSAKPNTNPPPPAVANAGGGALEAFVGSQASFPAAKGQLYNRPMYRPQPPAKRRQRSRRGCYCACCCWLVLILLALIILAAIAGGIFYVLYLPQRPTFSVSSLRLSTLNVSSSNQLTTRLDFALTARNPNKKIVFLYNPISISVSSKGVDIGDGSFPAFVHGTKNTTVMRATVSSSGQSLDPSVAADLKKSNIDLEIDLETKAGIKVGNLKTKKVGIQVHCNGIHSATPKGKKVASPSTPDASCKVRLRIKIWKWTI